jgi:uncharacterized protein (DUF427 family)
VSLTTGRGPLSFDPAGRFEPPVPAGTTYIEPHPRRVQALVGDDVVLDTERALLVHRPDRTLTFAFPADVVGDLPHDPEPAAPGYVTVPWKAVGAWVEEGRRLVHYPPNPYHRVDCRPTRRRLRVSVGGEVIVDTDDTVIVFETALAPRLYVDRSQVGAELRRTETSTYCNYKGWATYWSVGEVADVAWSYDEPLAESALLRGLVAFDPEKTAVEAELPEGA